MPLLKYTTVGCHDTVNVLYNKLQSIIYMVNRPMISIAPPPTPLIQCYALKKDLRRPIRHLVIIKHFYSSC